MSASEQLPNLPTESASVLGVNTYLRGLQAQERICRVRTPAGDQAWLVTRHKEVKALLRDRRLGRAHPEPDRAPRYIDNPMMDMLRTGEDYAAEHEIHSQVRALLSPYFAGRHIVALEPRITAVVRERLDAIAGKTQPIDMQSEFSQPITMLMICELLGVPESEREAFPGLVHQVSGINNAEAGQGRNALYEYFAGLAARLRADPTEGILSGLVADGVDDHHVALLGLMMLHAAYGSTSSHMSIGILRLASTPELRDQLVRDPGLVQSAVEESLRTASPGGFTLPHYARDRIDIGGVTIEAGDLVLLDYSLANFDDEVFEDPERVDVTRTPNPHMTFAHGMWHCMGAPLARLQLKIAFSSLLERFPGMRLAVPVSEVEGASNRLGGELSQLPVTW